MPVKITEEEIRANRKLWTDALEGKYRKFRRHENELASPAYRSFCCLGVAAEAVPALGMKRLTGGRYRVEDGVLDVSLVKRQMEILGLSHFMTQFLIKLNDSYHASFSTIACVIGKLPVVVATPDSDFSTDFSEESFLELHPDIATLIKHR